MLTAPVIFMVVTATSFPVELRPMGSVGLDLSVSNVDWADVAENIAGYVPVSIVLADLGSAGAILAATLISTFAEMAQLAMMHRDPSVIDIAANVVGASLGTAISAHWTIKSPSFRINRWKAVAAAVMAALIAYGVWITSAIGLNARGATSLGTIEAHWKLDEIRSPIAEDSSGHGLNGKARGEPLRMPGVVGGAVQFDGAGDYIDAGQSAALRLVGSMTISAWIKPSSFPIDDAAIVSSHNGLGYQLDTTADLGPRTISFKLADECGNLMARYGATHLKTNVWYHVAGVYDADSRTINVYLNGEPDDGILTGTVTRRQHSSRAPVYIGRRSDTGGFYFAGLIDDVRIYSRALTQAEIIRDIGVKAMSTPGLSKSRRLPAQSILGTERPKKDLHGLCAGSDPEDARLPAAIASIGVLAAVACVGLWPSGGPMLSLIVCLAAGLLLAPTLSFTLPSFARWMMPLVSLAGGVSVVLSVRRQQDLA
jgi:hypothetical protein